MLIKNKKLISIVHFLGSSGWYINIIKLQQMVLLVVANLAQSDPQTPIMNHQIAIRRMLDDICARMNIVYPNCPLYMGMIL